MILWKHTQTYFDDSQQVAYFLDSEPNSNGDALRFPTHREEEPVTLLGFDYLWHSRMLVGVE